MKDNYHSGQAATLPGLFAVIFDYSSLLFNNLKFNFMFTATQTDQRRKYLENEINKVEIKLIYANNFSPHKVEYYREQLEQLRYELTYVS